MVTKEHLHLLVIPSNPQRTDFPSLEWLVAHDVPSDIDWGYQDMCFRMRPIHLECARTVENRGPLCDLN